jgi:hypothetical protein
LKLGFKRMFRNHGGHQIKCNGQNLKDSKRSIPPALSTMAGLMEHTHGHVCARACK